MSLLRGQQFRAYHSVSTVLPDFDFETYSEAGYRWDSERGKWDSLDGIATSRRGLKVVGTRNYVQHPSFRVLCLAYNLKDGTGPKSWRPDMPPPQDLLDYVASGGLIEAFNVEFEREVWNGYCVPKLSWPPLSFEQLRCCMAKAVAFSLPPSLDDVGKVLKITQQKDAKGSAIMRKLTTPRQPTKANPALKWEPWTAPEEFARLYSYNVQDINAEGEASLRIPDLHPRELEIWQIDQRINERGMQLDLSAVEDCIACFQAAQRRDEAELYRITNGAVGGVSEVAASLQWLRYQGVYLPNLDEDTVELELTKQHTPAVKRLLEIRKACSFGSVKKLLAMRAQACADGRLRSQYAFHGAHTSLWNGRGVQVANLYKGSFNKPEQIELALGILATRDIDFVERAFANGPPWERGPAMSVHEVIANCLRSMIVARSGARLISSDYTAIQAVVTSALAKEEWRMEVFRTHGKIYETMASRLTGNPLQFYLDYRKQNGKHHPDRQLGKLAVLSADFGAWVAGWKRFGAEDYGDDDWLKATILKTRAAQPRITELWGGQTRNRFGRDEQGRRANEFPELYGLEGAAISAVLNPGQCYGYHGVRYLMTDGVLFCLPPSGGAPLVYHEPRLERSSRDYARPWEFELYYMGWESDAGWCPMKLYGGALTQNVVAKVAREFQANSLVALERTGVYLPVMHTHDEIVTEVEHGRGSVPEYLAIVNSGAPWAIDDKCRPWPVKVPAAEETYRNGKWE
jgi:DNA polymerase